MKRRDVIQRLAAIGAIIVREGGEHTIYGCSCGRHQAAVPRHREHRRSRRQHSEADRVRSEGMAAVSDYRATAHREGEWWVIDVVGVGATQAKRLDRVEHMARDLVASMRGLNYNDVTVQVSYELEPALVAVVAAAQAAAEDAKEAQKRATELSRAAVNLLRAERLSLRDIAAIIGVSFQRVHQLAHTPVGKVIDTAVSEAVKATEARRISVKDHARKMPARPRIRA